MRKMTETRPLLGARWSRKKKITGLAIECFVLILARLNRRPLEQVNNVVDVDVKLNFGK